VIDDEQLPVSAADAERGSLLAEFQDLTLQIIKADSAQEP
jgi:hypothetical protein